MYTVILWDIDNTLLDFNASEKYAFDTCLKEAGITPTDQLLASYSGLNLSLWKRLERGEITREELLSTRFRAFLDKEGIKGVDDVWMRREYQKLLGSVWFFRDNSLELCRRLGRHYRQYAVTNGVSATQRDKMRLSGLSGLLDGIFISEELGCEKPSVSFFERAFARIPDFKKEEALLAGDSLTSDMQGAEAAGLDSCWYNPEGLPKPDSVKITYEIKNLWEIQEILKSQR